MFHVTQFRLITTWLWPQRVFHPEGDDFLHHHPHHLSSFARYKWSHFVRWNLLFTLAGWHRHPSNIYHLSLYCYRISSYDSFTKQERKFFMFRTIQKYAQKVLYNLWFLEGFSNVFCSLSMPRTFDLGQEKESEKLFGEQSNSRWTDDVKRWSKSWVVAHGIGKVLIVFRGSFHHLIIFRYQLFCWDSLVAKQKGKFPFANVSALCSGHKRSVCPARSGEHKGSLDPFMIVCRKNTPRVTQGMVRSDILFGS